MVVTVKRHLRVSYEDAITYCDKLLVYGFLEFFNDPDGDGEFINDKKVLYTFLEDDFDKYLNNLPHEQVYHISKLKF